MNGIMKLLGIIRSKREYDYELKRKIIVPGFPADYVAQKTSCSNYRVRLLLGSCPARPAGLGWT